MNNSYIRRSFGLTIYEFELYFGYTYQSMFSMVERISLDDMASEVNAEVVNNELKGSIDER